MHDLHCKNASEIHSKILAERVYELKETQKGVDLMCREMEKLYNDGMEIGEKRGMELGELKAKREAAVSMAEDGMAIDKIARLIKVSTEEVRQWLDEVHVI